MFDFLLPIFIIAIPVFAVVLLTVATGRRLQPSCGGVGPNGRCGKCGKEVAAIPVTVRPDGAGPCS